MGTPTHSHSGWLWIKSNQKKLLSLFHRNVWKKCFFRLEGERLVYFIRDHKKPPKKPLGVILLRNTYLEINCEFKATETSSSKLYQFCVVPIVLDKEYQLQEQQQDGSNGSAITPPTLIESERVTLCADTEEEMSSWVSEILRASSLFAVDETQTKNVPLLIQQSIRDPSKHFNQARLAELTPRSIQIENEDDDDDKGDESEDVVPLTDEQLLQQEKINVIIRYWKMKRVRKEYVQRRKAAQLLTVWWKYSSKRAAFLNVQKSTRLLQKVWRFRADYKLYLALRKKTMTRKHLLKELLSTELTYVTGLNIAISCFYTPLKNQLNGNEAWDGKKLVDSTNKKKYKPMLTMEQLDCIFSNMESILMLHSNVVSQFNNRIYDTNPNEICVGDIFTDQGQLFKLYTQYINNYDLSIKTLSDICAKEARLSSFLKYQQQLLPEIYSQLPIESFLILPVQRLPRYELLLRDIMAYTLPEHKDYHNLQIAAAEINKVIIYLNENKRAIDNMNQLLSIQRKFANLTEDLLLPHRKYIKQGELFEMEGAKVIAKRQCFLFSDILLGADIKGSTFTSSTYFTLAWTIPLINSDVVSIDEVTFNVGTVDTQISISLRAESENEMESWLNAIKTQLRNFSSSINVATPEPARRGTITNATKSTSSVAKIKFAEDILI